MIVLVILGPTKNLIDGLQKTLSGFMLLSFVYIIC